MKELEARLERLERQNRRLKQLGLLVLVVGFAIVLLGQTSARKTVEAQNFLVKDESGVVRGSFGVSNGYVMLTLYGPQGGKVSSQLRAELGAGNAGPFLWLMDGDKGTTRVKLDSESLLLADAAGKTRLLLDAAVDKRSGAALLIFGSDSRERLSLFGGDSDVGIRLSDTKGFSLHLGSTELEKSKTGEKSKTSAASIVLFGKDGNVLWAEP